FYFLPLFFSCLDFSSKKPSGNKSPESFVWFVWNKFIIRFKISSPRDVRNKAITRGPPNVKTTTLTNKTWNGIEPAVSISHFSFLCGFGRQKIIKQIPATK